MAVVVFPTPPFWFASEMILATVIVPRGTSASRECLRHREGACVRWNRRNRRFAAQPATLETTRFAPHPPSAASATATTPRDFQRRARRRARTGDRRETAPKRARAYHREPPRSIRIRARHA